MSARIFIDTGQQAVQQAVQAFSDSHGIPRNTSVEQELSTKLVAFAKGMDLSPGQFRHIATRILNDEKRIQAGTNSAEHRQELAMQAVADLKAQMRVNSTTRVLQFVAALNAYLREHHGDLHRVLAENDQRGGSLGSEPFIVRHLAAHFNKHLRGIDKASRSAKWPQMKAAHVVSATVPPGGVLSGHIPESSVTARMNEMSRATALQAAGVPSDSK